MFGVRCLKLSQYCLVLIGNARPINSRRAGDQNQTNGSKLILARRMSRKYFLEPTNDGAKSVG